MRSFVIGDRALGSAGDTHPEGLMAYGQTLNYWIVGASAVGQLHYEQHLPRDDAFVVRSVGPWLAISVADGLGSHKYSRYAASYVVEALSTHLLRLLAGKGQTTNLPPDDATVNFGTTVTIGKAPQLNSSKKTIGRDKHKTIPLDDYDVSNRNSYSGSVAWHRSKSIQGYVPGGHLDTPAHDLVAVAEKAFEKTHLGLREHGKQLQMPFNELGCTALGLLINVLTGIGVACQIGDGAILGLTDGNNVRQLATPQDTGNPQQTYTLNNPEFKSRLRVEAVRPPTETCHTYYLMTDGLSENLLHSGDPTAVKQWAVQMDSILRKSSNPYQTSAELLRKLAEEEIVGSGDDRTLVILQRR